MLDPFATWLILAAIVFAVYMFVFFERSAAPEISAPVVSDSVKHAESLAEDLRALEWLDDIGQLYSASELDDLDSEYLEEITPEELRAARYLVDDLARNYDEAGNWSGAYFLDVLDIENHYKVSAGQVPDLDYVSALISFGGPNIWIDSNNSGWLKIRVYWAGDNATREVYAPSVCNSLWAAGEISNYFEVMA